MDYSCADCGVDTMQARESYMVDNTIWECVTANDPAQFLCIGCLEARWGRELVRDDFLPVLLNVQERSDKSERLATRLGDFTRTYIDLIHHRFHNTRIRNSRLCGISYACELCDEPGLLKQLQGIQDRS